MRREALSTSTATDHLRKLPSSRREDGNWFCPSKIGLDAPLYSISASPSPCIYPMRRSRSLIWPLWSDKTRKQCQLDWSWDPNLKLWPAKALRRADIGLRNTYQHLWGGPSFLYHDICANIGQIWTSKAEIPWVFCIRREPCTILLNLSLLWMSWNRPLKSSKRWSLCSRGMRSWKSTHLQGKSDGNAPCRKDLSIY